MAELEVLNPCTSQHCTGKRARWRGLEDIGRRREGWIYDDRCGKMGRKRNEQHMNKRTRARGKMEAEPGVALALAPGGIRDPP